MTASHNPADMADSTQDLSTTSVSFEDFRKKLPAEVRQTLFRASDLKRRQQGRERSAVLPTSMAGFDRLLGGGLGCGSLVEIVGRRSSGRFAILLAALRAVTGAGEAAALIDQGGQLDPQNAARAGIELEHLLWLCPQRVPDSLAAAEMLVHAGFLLVALDFGLPPVRGRAPLAAWLRLARSCSDRDATVVIGAPYRLSGCAADVVVTAGRAEGRWSGSRGGLRLLEGLSAELKLAKRRGHRPEMTDLLTLSTAGSTDDHNSQAGERNVCHVQAL